jgi:hypothetical protein
MVPNIAEYNSLNKEGIDNKYKYFSLFFIVELGSLVHNKGFGIVKTVLNIE